MKKILLVLLLFITAITTKAQIGGGYNFAMNFGGAGAEVKGLQIDAQGNTYFLANVNGRAVFAGQQIDGGSFPGYAIPTTKSVFGKIAPDGTQTLIKILPQTTTDVTISKTGELFAFYVGNANYNYDFGNGVTMNTWGLYLVKFNNNGEGQYIKKVTVGNTNYEYGNAGLAIPNIHGMQVTPDGNLYAGISSGNVDSAAPNATFKYPFKIAKFDVNGVEVWHNDIYSVTWGNLEMPEQFVSNDGRLSFGLNSTTNQWYFNGASIASEMSNYTFGNSLYTYIASLKPDGTKNFAVPSTLGTLTLKGINPVTGDLYVYYGNGNVSIIPTTAPYNLLPNNYPSPNPYNYYLFGGLLTFNNIGVYQGYTTKFFDNKLIKLDNGFLVYEKGYANSPVDKGGNYVFNDTKPFGIVSYYDDSFNFLKAVKTPEVKKFAVNGNKVSIANSFKGSLTMGSATLTQSFNDTDFQTRFPSYASVKADIYIAQADGDNITPPPSSNWLGVDNNWNNTANWSTGLVPDANTIVGFNNTVANMPTTATTPTALKVIINAGVTASLPAELVIKTKLIINGTLQINHTGALNFSNYSALAIEGTGTLSFNGTSTPSVTAYGLKGYKDLSLSTNENITTVPGVYKNITFTGTSAIITAMGGIEITSPDVNAISGHSATNYIAGPITRAVNSNGAYVFPNAQFSYLKSEPTTLTLHNLSGTTKITVANDNGPSAPDVNFASGTTTSVLGDYYWRITPDVTPTGGTYDVSFSKSVFTNGVTDANRYVVINRIATGNPWSFDGTKTPSTQTGGTTSGSTVSNATVVAGLTGLTKFAEFAIGINSTPVTNGTAVKLSTWTGNSNTTWNDAGNWSNGIPNGTVNAAIPTGLIKYPAIYTATDNARSLTIASGISNMKLSHVLKLTNGLVNNSTIEIAGLVGYGGQFKAYDGGISGSGKLVFKNGGLISSLYGGVFNNDIDIDLGSTIDDYMTILGKIGGNINVISGAVNASTSASIDLELTNPSSTITIASPINHIAGTVYKSVNTSGSYILPIGDEQFARNGVRKYGEITITNNAIAAPSVYAVKFDSYWIAPLSLTVGTDVYTSFINSGQWFITPSNFSTTGTIDLTLKTDNYTNGRATTADYVLMRRATTATNVSTPWVIVPGATITENGGTITATATGLAPFSTNTMFCIGLKAATTTWTGAAGTANWNTDGNWSNGIPTEDVKAIIANVNAGRFYPNNAPTSGSAAAAIEIASGSTLTLPSTFYTPSGIINNGTINISGSGTFYGFGNYPVYSPISGSGKIVFGSSSPSIIESYYTGQTINNGIEINNPAGVALARATTFTGNVILTNGSVTVPDFSYTYFIMNNPNATILGSATGYIKGMLKRTVNASGTYNFPVGTATIYAPTSLDLTGLVGTTDITASFNDAAIDGQPTLTIGDKSVKSILAGGSWKISPNAQPSAGTYGVTLSAPLGASAATDFYVLKRTDNYSFYPWANQGTNVASTLNAAVVTASSSGLTSFSQFGIGEGKSTLPVKLTVFSATAVANSAKLYWETASELNNDKFEIERSINGTAFIKIGEVKGSGTSQKLNTYSFRDLAPSNGANYYRLKQLDLNGNSEYSEARVVKFNLKDVVFNIYPNPATDGINFSETLKSVEIYSISGAQVFRQTGSVSSIKFPSSIKNGIYIVRATLADGSVVSKQIIIR